MIGAQWDDIVGGWLLPRTPDDLERARKALDDQLPGSRGPEAPYVVETARGLQLFSPYADREVAKGITGARWEADERCWLYPRTEACLAALEAAFGPRLVVPRQLRRSLTPALEPASCAETNAGAVELDDAIAGAGSQDVAHRMDDASSGSASDLDGITDAAACEEADVASEGSTSDVVAASGPAPWSSLTERPAAVEWLAGNVHKLVVDEQRAEPSPEGVACRLVRGAFSDARDLAALAIARTPMEGALLLAARLCAGLQAASPAQLSDVEIDALAETGVNDEALLDLALDADLPDDAAALVAMCVVAAMTGMGTGQAATMESALSRISTSAEVFGRSRYLAAWWRVGAASTRDRELRPAEVVALAAVCSTREFSDLAVSAFNTGAYALFGSLLRDGFAPVIQHGRVRDMQKEVFEVLAAAELLNTPTLPAVANQLGDALEDGELVDGYASVDQARELHEFAFSTALAFDAASELRHAWERLMRWLAGQGEIAGVVATAQRVAFRPALRSPAETAIALALAERGESAAAVHGLIAAARRIRPAAPTEADDLLLEAAAIASEDAELMLLIEAAAPAPPPSADTVQTTWPVGRRALVIGGREPLRARGMTLLAKRGIVADWLTTEEAHNGDGLRARIRGATDVVVLLTPHISHSITYRAEEAAGTLDKPLLLSDRYGPGQLPQLLLDWAAGRKTAFRAGGM